MEHMVKIFFLITSILLFSSPANAELTLGLDFFQDLGDRTVASKGTTDYALAVVGDSAADAIGYRLRLGFDSIKESRVELYFSGLDEEKEMITYKNEWEFGVNYIITFPPLSESVTPYLKTGLGYGHATDTDVEFKVDNLYNIPFNFGGGMSYSFSDNVAVSGGIEYIYRNWKDVQDEDDTITVVDNLLRFNIGINISF
jgi:opacity protein-like surface antigen